MMKQFEQFQQIGTRNQYIPLLARYRIALVNSGVRQKERVS
jgi:hypothetical protein